MKLPTLSHRRGPMDENSFFKGLLAAELVLWAGFAYLLARSLFARAELWMVLALAVLCVQGLLVLYMTAYRFRFGTPEPYPAVRTASGALVWLALLFALYPVYGPRVLALLDR